LFAAFFNKTPTNNISESEIFSLKKKTIRGGRKVPRPGDIDVDKVIRVDDSLEVDKLVLESSKKENI